MRLLRFMLLRFMFHYLNGILPTVMISSHVVSFDVLNCNWNCIGLLITKFIVHAKNSETKINSNWTRAERKRKKE